MEKFFFCTVLQSAVEHQIFCEDTHLHNFINFGKPDLKQILLFKRLQLRTFCNHIFIKKKNVLTYLYAHLLKEKRVIH